MAIDEEYVRKTNTTMYVGFFLAGMIALFFVLLVLNEDNYTLKDIDSVAINGDYLEDKKIESAEFYEYIDTTTSEKIIVPKEQANIYVIEDGETPRLEIKEKVYGNEIVDSLYFPDKVYNFYVNK